MENFGRFLMVGGIVLFIIGGGIYLAVKFGIPIGRLPGDIHIERDDVSLHFPLVSSIIISILLSLLLNILMRLFRK